MLVILSGVSGAGKDTIKKELLKREDNIVTIPSITDRPMRTGEVEGVPYHFVSTEEFEKMIENGELYEYNVHHNHYYGTSKKVFNDKNKGGKIIVKDIDVNGTENLINILRQKKVFLIIIFLFSICILLFDSNSNTSSMDATEKKLSNILSQIENVGKVEVMITYEDVSTFSNIMNTNEKTNNVKGVIVVAKGVDNYGTKYYIEQAVKTALCVTSNQVDVFIMEE